MLHLFAGDDGVEEAVFEEELGALEALWELLTNGLLDDAGAGESDKGFGFGYVEVAEHREAGRNAAGRRVGHDGDVGDFFVVEAGQAIGDFCQLHQRGDALHHARATGGRDDDERMPCGERAVYSAGDGFADDGAHAAADEAVFHDAEDNVVRAKLSDGVDDGVVEAGLLLGIGEALFVGLEVSEVERVCRAKFKIDEFVTRLEKIFDAFARADAEVVTALGANLLVGLEFGLEDDLPAARASDPKAFGADRLLGVVDDLIVFAFEPAHAWMPSGNVPRPLY